MKVPFHKFKRYIILTICFIMFLSMNISFGQDIDECEEFDSEDICGGVKIFNGNRYKMTASEAQFEYLQEKNFEKIIEYNDYKIKSGIIVKTEINNARLYNGKNVRISTISHNNTSSPIIKKISGTTIVIKPGKKFYKTFTPKILEVKGRQLHSIPHGVTKWENFTSKFPRTVNGQADGNIYFITK